MVNMQHGMREIERTYDKFEIIDANDADNDLVSLADRSSIANTLQIF